ncbi:MAG: hypothetical protein ACYCS7_06880 [Acidimicrobiales bacterium]
MAGPADAGTGLQRFRYIVFLSRRPSSAAFELFMLAVVIGAVLAAVLGGVSYILGHSFHHTTPR